MRNLILVILLLLTSVNSRVPRKVDADYNGWSRFRLNYMDNVECYFVDSELFNVGKSQEITGNADIVDFIPAPVTGKRLLVKGLLIHGEGNNGETHIESSDQSRHLLTLYHANSSNLTPSGEVNLVIPSGQGVRVRTISRNVSKTFIGISYRVISDELADRIIASNKLD